MAEGTSTKKKWLSAIRFYLTAIAILVACFSSFAFLFLVPFVIDPAFSTLFAEFVDEPTTCTTESSEFKLGMSNCSWSSCREGCTREIFQCTQIYVSYTMAEEATPRTNISLYPNVKGCGYPPEVNCTMFDEKYSTPGTTFPCYYSALMPDIALTDLNLEKVKMDLIYAIAVPWSLFMVSILYLLITYAGMSRPDPKMDEAVEVKSLKGASKVTSTNSLKSLARSVHQGNKSRSNLDEKGAVRAARGTSATRDPHTRPPQPMEHLPPISIRTSTGTDPFRRTAKGTTDDDDAVKNDSDLLLEPANLQQVHSRRVLPPLERAPTSRTLGGGDALPVAS
ncbi:Na+ channel auxiliary subunit TipE [Trinorchestia longiramus]|nr:Na+ channel auxiliary subunit TipE [Trinorchestia longiramus]